MFCLNSRVASYPVLSRSKYRSISAYSLAFAEGLGQEGDAVGNNGGSGLLVFGEPAEVVEITFEYGELICWTRDYG